MVGRRGTAPVGTVFGFLEKSAMLWIALDTLVPSRSGHAEMFLVISPHSLSCL
jgi:hypothetical protein